VSARRKLLIYWFLCRRIRPIRGGLEPRESGCRFASGSLIIDRDVPRSSAADLLRWSGGRWGELEWVKRAPLWISVGNGRLKRLFHFCGQGSSQPRVLPEMPVVGASTII
jgi:hypothetical protein